MGTVSLIGRPNAGKSTLLNQLIGQKVSITASRAQTTRTLIRGVYDDDDTQLVFVDTPGLVDDVGRTLLARQMNKRALSALADVDALVLVVDAYNAGKHDANEALLVDHIPRSIRSRTVVALNKIDRLANVSATLPLMRRWGGYADWAAIVPISARSPAVVELLVPILRTLMPSGERQVPAETVTDSTQRFLAAEFVREQCMRLLGDELPYVVTTRCTDWREKGRLTVIHVTIFVERESHKGIVIGAGGAMIKRIGTCARQSIEQMTECQVHLALQVKMVPKWREQPSFVADQ